MLLQSLLDLHTYVRALQPIASCPGSGRNGNRMEIFKFPTEQDGLALILLGMYGRLPL